MPKKYEIADFKMSVEFTCPKCMKRIKQEVELNPINSKFSWYENPCEMCGSRGNLSYDPGICTHCKLVWPSITIDKF